MADCGLKKTVAVKTATEKYDLVAEVGFEPTTQRV